ncbi:hypothetical protein [Maricaulis maris]|uniref:Uncharacterized protein n=1 Tax=Maricaulis maris TaxID=74318 RepID=A0A495DJU5_9PROT|nr:hypothetical protein [Maricaulis maris]RKR02904.1 hypothetical protein C7435_0848 [Maricaulis maris]
MSEPQGQIANDPVVMGVWKRLTQLFAVWRLIVFAGFSKRMLYQVTNDQMSTLMRSRHWKLGLGLLGGLDEAQIIFLADWARLNAERTERIFRSTALIIVSIPVAAVFGISELDPGIWESLGFARLDTLIFIIGAWMLVSGVMMAAAWRARDLADLLDLEKARRALKRAQAGAESA